MQTPSSNLNNVQLQALSLLFFKSFIEATPTWCRLNENHNEALIFHEMLKRTEVNFWKHWNVTKLSNFYKLCMRYMRQACEIQVPCPLIPKVTKYGQVSTSFFSTILASCSKACWSSRPAQLISFVLMFFEIKTFQKLKENSVLLFQRNPAFIMLLFVIRSATTSNTTWNLNEWNKRMTASLPLCDLHWNNVGVDEF